MFVYEKKLQYPVKISTPNPRLASFIISQYGGPDGELGASIRYLSQRYAMPYPELKGLLTDIGTEELGHLEMIGAIVHQLTRGLNDQQVREGGFAPYFVDHTTGVYPTAASGSPWNAAGIGVKGDIICDLTEDMAADGALASARIFSPPLLSPVLRFISCQRKGGFILNDAIYCKNVFQNESSTPDGAAYTRIWLELVRRAVERDICLETQVPDGDA